MDSLFKSAQGKKEILDLYDQELAELNIAYNSQFVDTRYGKTHVIVTGDASHPPLVLVHGSNGCAPIALKCYPHLRERFQVFAVDVLAQPNKSAETRLSMKDESYGVWLNEVMAGLDIEEATLAGFSFGGLVILKTLIHNKKRVKEAFLAAPAYIVNGNPIEALFKVFIPMKRFMRKQNPKFIDKFLSVLFTEKDDFAAKFLPKVFSHFTMDFSPLPVLHKKEAQQINTPITLIAAQKDIFFPGKKMIKRAQKLLPSLKRTVLLDQSRHVQNSEDNRMIERLVMESSRGA